MKKLLLLLMIVPMIGFGQQDTSGNEALSRCYKIIDNMDADYDYDVSPEQLINLLSSGAEFKDPFVISSVQELMYNSEECDHLNEFRLLLKKGEDGLNEDLSNREIKTLNRYISQWSNLYADYVSPVIEFGGKEYIIVGILTSGPEDWTIDADGYDTYNRTLLFTNNERGSNNWKIILHPEKQKKAIHKFFKNEKNWNSDRIF